jgi:hypothetical protein
VTVDPAHERQTIVAESMGGDVVVYLVNAGTTEQPVLPGGLPGGTYRQVLSTEAGVGQEREAVAGGGTAPLTLPEERLALLTTRADR